MPWRWTRKVPLKEVTSDKGGNRWEVYAGDFMFTMFSAALLVTGSSVRCWQFSESKESRNIAARYNTQDSQEKDSS